MSRARLFDRRAEHRRAIPDWVEAKKNDDGSRATTLFKGATLSMVKTGEHQVVFQVLNRVLKRSKSVPFNHFIRLCCLCADAAEQDAKLKENQRHELSDKYERRALEILTSADASEYYRDPVQLRDLVQQPDFGRLRKRTEFLRFLAKRGVRIPVPAKRPE